MGASLRRPCVYGYLGSLTVEGGTSKASDVLLALPLTQRPQSRPLPRRLPAIVAASLGAVPGALADSGGGNGRALGLISVHGSRLGTGRTVAFDVPGNGAKASGGKGRKGGGGTLAPLTYHGGSIFSTPYRIYDIYWVPAGYAVAAGYQSTVDGFVQNVASASGSTTNVFSTATQYTDTTGAHVAYSASFGGSVTVTDPFPASGCTDSALPNSPLPV